MKQPSRIAIALPAALLALGALGCGGNKPAEQATATPEAATSDSAAPPAATAEAPPAPQAAANTPAPPAAPPKKPATASSSGTHAPAAPAPKPEPVVKTLVTGTDIAVELQDAASSKTNQVGDTLRARVTKDVAIDGLVAIPQGAVAVGTVTEAVPVKKIGGAASLGVRFDKLQLPDGKEVLIEASIHEKAKSETGKDAGTIAGATAGGALLGRLLSKHDKTKGTIIGAAVGAAAGTGAAVATKGKEVEFAPGTPFTLKLEAPADVTILR